MLVKTQREHGDSDIGEETPWRFWYHADVPLAASIQAALDWHLLKNGIAANELLCWDQEYIATKAAAPPGLHISGTKAMIQRHIMVRYNPKLEAGGE